MGNETMIEVKHLKKYFKTAYGMLHAVDDVSFEIKKGQTLGVVGESGCGKSTLGRVMIHLLEATSGEVIFNGKDVTKAGKKELFQLRKDMQIIFQDPFSSLNPRMTVSEIISEPFYIYKTLKNRSEIEKRTAELMDIVGLARRLAYSYPHELDGGRRQRIGVARALALNPKFMQDLQEQMGLTYVFITHDLSVVKHISDEIMVMYLGCVVEKCPADELFEHHFHPYTKGLLSAIPIPKIGAAKKRILLQGELSSPIDPKPCCRFASRCPYAKKECFEQQPELWEVRTGHFVACHYVKEINELK